MIRIYSITIGPEDCLAYQRATFDAFLAEEFELVVVNDGQSPDACAAIDAAARSLELRCVRTGLPACGDPSIGLGAAMEYTLHELAARDEISLFVHGDVFAAKPFSVLDLLDDAVAVAVPERRQSADGAVVVNYPWSGVVGLRPAELPDCESIRFGPGEVQGVRCDTGGMFALYAARHPSLRLTAVTKVTVSAQAGNGWLLPDVPPAVLAGRGTEIVAGSLLHCLGGSGWLRSERALQATKRAATFAILDRLLDGGQGLANFAPEAAQPWPGRSS